MKNNVERPMDLLNNSKGKEVLVYLKNGRQFSGKLLAFDVHVNIALDNAKEMENNKVKKNIGLTFLRGDTIIYISPVAAGKE